MESLIVIAVCLALLYFYFRDCRQRYRPTEPPPRTSSSKRNPFPRYSFFNCRFYPPDHPLYSSFPWSSGSQPQKRLKQKELQEIAEEIDAISRKVGEVIDSIDRGAIESNKEVWELIGKSRSLLWSASNCLTGAISAEQIRLASAGTGKRKTATNPPQTEET